MRSPVLRWRALSGTLVPLQTEMSGSDPGLATQTPQEQRYLKVSHTPSKRKIKKEV